MSAYIRREIGDSANIWNVSDYHVGSKAFHAEAAQYVTDKILADPIGYVTFGGDAVEAKLIDSPHFNPDSLRPRQLDAHKQADAFCEIWQPLAGRTLLYMPGNHDQYLAPNWDLPRYIAERCGMIDVLGSYQSWLNCCGLTFHFWHGRNAMPRGAKDPIQREANQKAWLKNRMERLAGSASAQYMAHTHACMVVPPQEQYYLLDSGPDCKARSFTVGAQDVDGSVFIPPSGRWYVNTGTLRRGGMFGYQDYAEVAGYPPQPIECTVTRVRNRKIVAIDKVLL